jgi:hypothetical protein
MCASCQLLPQKRILNHNRPYGLPLLCSGCAILGWIEGRTIAIEYRWAEARSQRYGDIAAEFVELKVDVILTQWTLAVIAAKQATSVIAIVFVSDGPGSASRVCIHCHDLRRARRWTPAQARANEAANDAAVACDLHALKGSEEVLSCSLSRQRNSQAPQHELNKFIDQPLGGYSLRQRPTPQGDNRREVCDDIRQQIEVA